MSSDVTENTSQSEILDGYPGKRRPNVPFEGLSMTIIPSSGEDSTLAVNYSLTDGTVCSGSFTSPAMSRVISTHLYGDREAMWAALNDTSISIPLSCSSPYKVLRQSGTEPNTVYPNMTKDVILRSDAETDSSTLSVNADFADGRKCQGLITFPFNELGEYRVFQKGGRDPAVQVWLKNGSSIWAYMSCITGDSPPSL